MKKEEEERVKHKPVLRGMARPQPNRYTVLMCVCDVERQA